MAYVENPDRILKPSHPNPVAVSRPKTSMFLSSTCLAILTFASCLLGFQQTQDPVHNSPDCLAFATVASLPGDFEAYKGVPYYFLGTRNLSFTVHIAPQEGVTLDLLWGAKNDTRSAQITINGQAQTIHFGGYDGFQWQRVKLDQPISGDAYQVTMAAAGGKAAFVAAIRLVDQTMASNAPFEAAPDPHHITIHLPEMVDGWPLVESYASLPLLERSGMQARRALVGSHRFTLAWLALADPESGLIPENLSHGLDRWNGCNNAADNYAFMVLTTALTDRKLFDGRMLDMLHSEQRLTSRIDNLSDTYRFSTRSFEHKEADLNRIIFDNSEYVKDGLMPLTEWLGPSPWSERMSGIIDDIWKHAPVETSAGMIPSKSPEVNGEMMQLTARYFWLTGERRYLNYAIRIADWYLLGDRHPTRDSTSLKLRDHGCELISGLTEVYFACSYADKIKAAEYKAPLHEMLDCILQYGADENGMLFNSFNPQSGVATSKMFSDNWGYNYNGFYTVYLVDGTLQYRDAVRKVLGKLDHYESYAWEGRSHDGYADSIESAINLYNREPIDVAAKWIDSQMRIMLAMQREDGIIGGWHGDGNFARTAIMYALWKQQGVTVQPWRADVRLGAHESGGALQLLIAADKAWQGRLVFDSSRHKTVMQMPLDYPRINQFPEWYTVDPQREYSVSVGSVESKIYSGRQLLDGLPIKLTSPTAPVQLQIRLVNP